jgi:hypothetical protein
MMLAALFSWLRRRYGPPLRARCISATLSDEGLTLIVDIPAGMDDEEMRCQLAAMVARCSAESRRCGGGGFRMLEPIEEVK